MYLYLLLPLRGGSIDYKMLLDIFAFLLEMREEPEGEKVPLRKHSTQYLAVVSSDSSREQLLNVQECETPPQESDPESTVVLQHTRSI